MKLRFTVVVDASTVVPTRCFVIADHQYFVAVQYHPEYISRPMKPSPPYLGLLLASCGKLNSYMSRGCRLSPHVHTSIDYSDSDISDDDDSEVAELSSGIESLKSGDSNGSTSEKCS